MTQAQMEISHLGEHTGEPWKHIHLPWRYLLAAQDAGQVPDLLQGAWTSLF